MAGRIPARQRIVYLSKSVRAMANAVFTTSESSAYDDQPELRYHFPKTYLSQVERAVGDWIVYY